MPRSSSEEQALRTASINGQERRIVGCDHHEGQQAANRFKRPGDVRSVVHTSSRRNCGKQTFQAKVPVSKHCDTCICGRRARPCRTRGALAGGSSRIGQMAQCRRARSRGLSTSRHTATTPRSTDGPRVPDASRECGSFSYRELRQLARPHADDFGSLRDERHFEPASCANTDSDAARRTPAGWRQRGVSSARRRQRSSVCSTPNTRADS